VNQSAVIKLFEKAGGLEDTDFITTLNPRSTWVFDNELFRHAQKTEAVGRLAAGVAHDFYNILTIIQGYAVLLMKGERSQTEINFHLNQISSAANRGAILTRQLLNFSRRDAVQFEPIDINALIDNLSNMLRRLLGEDTSLETGFCPTLKPVLGDTGMLEQVLMNLVVNARDAIANGGNISISTDAVQICANHVELHPQARVGEFACVSVCDTGCGMTQDVLRHIFEPFFTTKEADKGTGLGLATVRDIVQQHSGWIEVRTQVGVGTEFKVYLPSAPVSAIDGHRKARMPCISSGNETVLLVEDEDQVRGLAAYILKWHGYQVIQAESPAKALAVWQEKCGSIDLLVTDMVMPEMSGQELAKKLRETKPGLKVVYTSGYSAARAGQDPSIWSGPNFVAKPYSPDKLVQAVQDCLANR
jgi:nitrogen-specific signal transduction histidine kinase/ActR/RegA family two-component response regulator